MSDLIGLEEAHDPFEEALERISILIDGVVAQQCARHYGARTQEHQFTSRLAEAIVGELGRFPVEGVQLEVVAQEFPDRGPHSMGKPSGADLYISVAVQSPERKISKGMLVQSKWDHTLSATRERRRILGASQKLTLGK